MQQQVQSDWLSLAAAVSLVPAAILICGYFSVVNVRLADVQASPVAQIRTISFGLDRGRVRIWLGTQTLPPSGAPTGRTMHWIIRPQFPDLRRCFWEFDNHSLTMAFNTKGLTAYIIAFPIWCVLLPWLIAPFLWLLKQRRSRTQIGFPIEVAANQISLR